MLARCGASPGSRTPLASLEDWRITAMLVRPGAYSLNRTGALCVFSAVLIPTELSRHGREPRSRTGFALRARPVPYLPSPGPPRPDIPAIRGGRGGIAAGQDACRYGAHAMEFSIIKPAMRRAGTAGIEPAHAALETAVLPLNYVPER